MQFCCNLVCLSRGRSKEEWDDAEVKVPKPGMARKVTCAQDWFNRHRGLRPVLRSVTLPPLQARNGLPQPNIFIVVRQMSIRNEVRGPTTPNKLQPTYRVMKKKRVGHRFSLSHTIFLSELHDSQHDVYRHSPQ